MAKNVKTQKMAKNGKKIELIKKFKTYPKNIDIMQYSFKIL